MLRRMSLRKPSNNRPASAFEAAQKRVAGMNGLADSRIVRMNQRPRVSRTVECAMTIGKRSDQTRVHRAADRNRSSPPGVVEKMIDDVAKRLILPADLQHLGPIRGREVINVPA